MSPGGARPSKAAVGTFTKEIRACRTCESLLRGEMQLNKGLFKIKTPGMETRWRNNRW